MDDREFTGPNGRATDTASPVNYFPGQDKRARRFTLYRDEHQVLMFDYHIEGDTRYVLYFEVEPAFRDGHWIQIVTGIKNYAKNYLDQDRVVWLHVSPYLAKTLPRILTAVQDLNEKDALFLKEVVIEGAVNNVVPLKDET